MRTILLLLVSAMLCAASAAERYKLTLFYPSYVGDVEFRPGDCRLLVDDNHVVLKQGRKTIEVDVTVENVGEKASKSSVRYAKDDGKYRISEIRLAGSDSKLVFN